MCQLETLTVGATAKPDTGKQTSRIDTCMVRANGMA